MNMERNAKASHPSCEEWMEYLYGELDTLSQARLTAHLQDCHQCQADVALWREAMIELSSWQLLERRSHRGVIKRVVAWGIAAMLLLGIGISIGRFSIPAPPDINIAKIRTELETSLKASIEPKIRQVLYQDYQELKVNQQAEFRQFLDKSIKTMHIQLYKELNQQLDNDVGKLTTDMVAASNAEKQRFLREFMKAYNEAQTGENETLLALLRQLESQRLSDYTRLRSDLETLVTLTETEFLHTRQGMALLFAYAQNQRAIVPEGTYTPNKSNERRLK